MSPQVPIVASADFAAWAQFWVQVVYTITTILLLIAAIWGAHIRSWVHPSKIEFEVAPHHGVLVNRGKDPNKPVWYFHLLVKNLQRSNPRKNAIVCCSGFNRTDSQGHRVAASYDADLPLFWAHWDVLGEFRDVFTQELCDLCYVDKDSEKLRIALILDNNALLSSISKDESIEFDVTLRHSEGVTGQAHVMIRWNGDWSQSHEQMKKNVTIVASSAKRSSLEGKSALGYG